MRKIIWACSECDEEYGDKETLKYHQKQCVKENQKEKHQNENPRLKCPHCDRSYTLTCNLNRHIRERHRTVSDEDSDDDANDDDFSNSPEGNQVAKGYALRTNVTRHVLLDDDYVTEDTDSNEDRWHCHLCAKNYSKNSNLQRHIRIAHKRVAERNSTGNVAEEDQSDNENQIPRLSFNARRRSDFTVGPTRALNKRAANVWACNFCDCKYTRRSTLRKHIEATHSNAPSGRHVAKRPLPRAETHAESKLSMLVKTMRSRPVEDSEEKEASNAWPCRFCSRSYTLRSNLMRHISVTHGKGVPETPPSNNTEYPWPCNDCGIGFTHRTKLVMHVACDHKDDSTSKQPTEKQVSLQKYTCPFCKKMIADVLWHCRNAHRIINPEELLFFDGTPTCSKEELENEHRYSKDVCRLCKSNVSGIELKTTEILNVHYVIDHRIDEANLDVIEKLGRKTKFLAQRKDVASKVSDEDNVVNEDSHNDRVIYKCKCGVSVESYEECVQHSQDHLIAQHTVNKECDICKYRFEATALIDHVSQHDGISTKGASVVHYDFETLLTEDWFETFKGLPETEISKIILSPYRHTRRIRMHLAPFDGENKCSGGAVYQCLMCDLFVDPTKIENHCINFDSCAKNKPRGHRCGRCSRLFYSADALVNHTRNRDADFKLVKFNDKKDAALNNILENLESFQNNPQESITRGTEENVGSSGYSTRWYCKTCQDYVDNSVVESHPHPLKILIRSPRGERDAKVPKKGEVEETVTRIDDGRHENDNDMDIDDVSIEKRGRDVSDCDSSSDTEHEIASKKRKGSSGQSIKKKLEMKIRREILEAKNRKAANAAALSRNSEIQTIEDLQRILEASEDEASQESEDSESSSGSEEELETDEEPNNSDSEEHSNQDVGDSEAKTDHEDASRSPSGDEEAETNEGDCQNPEDKGTGMELEQDVPVTEQVSRKELLDILEDNIDKGIQKDVSVESPEFSEDEYSDKNYSEDSGNENDEVDDEKDGENQMQSKALDLLKQCQDLLDPNERAASTTIKRAASSTAAKPNNSTP